MVLVESAALRDERRLDGPSLVDADDDQVERDALPPRRYRAPVSGCSGCVSEDEGTYDDLDNLEDALCQSLWIASGDLGREGGERGISSRNLTLRIGRCLRRGTG